MATAASLFGDLSNRVQRLSAVVTSGQGALAQGSLQQADVNHLFESTFLAAVARFETYLEELFYSVLLDKSAISNVRPSVRFPNRARAEDVLLAGSRVPYLAWLPFADNTLRRADAYLLGGRPFSRLRYRGDDRKTLSTVQTVRNGIAHDGGTARSNFKKLIKPQNLPPTHQTPAGYLRLAVGASTMHGTLLDEMMRVAKGLAAPSPSAANAILRAENSFSSHKPAPRGTYECVKCSVQVRKTDGSSSLPACAGCPPVVCTGCGQSTPCPTCGSPKRSSYRRILT